MTSPERISKYFTYHQAQQKDNVWNGRAPRVLIFPWLWAPKGHGPVQKYIDLYHDVGCDVIVMHINLLAQHLWPSSTRKFNASVISAMHDMTSDTADTFIVHAMSGGNYGYSDMHRDMTTNPRYQYLKDRIVGHVFDSLPISRKHSETISQVVALLRTSSVTLSASAKLMVLYLDATKKCTKDVFDRDVFGYFYHHLAGRENTPYLFYYGEDDPVCERSEIVKLLQFWKQERGLTVLEKHWPTSFHVKHLKEHRVDYITVFKQYIDIVNSGLLKNT
jgi:hypothetical protein